MAIPEFEQSLVSDLACIRGLADGLTAWGQRAALNDREIFQVNLVLEELVTNVIVHGLGLGRPGAIRVRVSHHGGGLAIELRDTAPPFDPFQVPPPSLTASLEEREVGGLGVHFVRTAMDEWSYSREGAENVVRLGKKLAGSG